MAAGAKILASKQRITLPFFPVKPMIEEMIKAYSAHFTVDGMRLCLLFVRKIRLDAQAAPVFLFLEVERKTRFLYRRCESA